MSFVYLGYLQIEKLNIAEPENNEYQLFLAIEDIDHSRTKAKSPQTNGICERFHRTIQNEFYAIAFRKKVYKSIDELQKDLDKWMEYYNQQRTHTGKYCLGKTPMDTFLQSKYLAKEKLIELINKDSNKTNFLPFELEMTPIKKIFLTMKRISYIS